MGYQSRIKGLRRFLKNNSFEAVNLFSKFTEKALRRSKKLVEGKAKKSVGEKSG